MKNYTVLLLLIVFATSCKTAQKASTENFFDDKDTFLDELVIEGKKHPYRPSYDIGNDLIHTDLDVRFDWTKQYLYGEAILTLSPYFYATDKVVLDAKGMAINYVLLLDNNLAVKDTLDYAYDSKKLTVSLDKTYNRTENYILKIDYVSKPNELEKTEGLQAISDDKGLFFINPLGEDKDKPRQIWTQGEPESNSVWFPTMDKPNERTTQEISITVENEFLAMSNGYLVSNIDNNDGTYTVTWRQDKPHAPYLFMMTIGDFAQIKDEWKNLSVDYFVEHEYKDVAQQIFGMTPDMLTYFENVLGVNYAWDKYWQVCVRDYVSGAMENTSAVIFGEFVQLNEKELNDDTFTEDIIAHELFHHWFGDLVTCESWANLPLNESFATYGEVMWREHRYGEDEKYRKILGDMKGYFREANSGKQVDVVRFHHDTAEDMFDGHSYAKGGVILNMLREIVGDEAFFLSLEKYIEDNKFQSVEIHNLRLAFEEVIGQDFNWFFNQWFLSAGHPIINIDYAYTDSLTTVKLNQEPSAEASLVYKLPMQVMIHYADGRTENQEIMFDQKEQEFTFESEQEIAWINVDAKKAILGELTFNQSEAHWEKQYNLANNMLDKYYALAYFESTDSLSEKAHSVFTKGLKDNYWYIQQKALGGLQSGENIKQHQSTIEKLAKNSERSAVQAEAISALSLLKNKEFEAIFVQALQANSYNVNGEALAALAAVNKEKALIEAEKFEQEDNYSISNAVGSVYSKVGDASKANYFTNNMFNNKDKYKRLYATYYYANFLNRMEPEMALKGIAKIVNYGKNDSSDFSKNVAMNALENMKANFTTIADDLKRKSEEKGLSTKEELAIENEMLNFRNVASKANAAIQQLMTIQ